MNNKIIIVKLGKHKKKIIYKYCPSLSHNEVTYYIINKCMTIDYRIIIWHGFYGNTTQNKFEDTI